MILNTDINSSISFVNETYETSVDAADLNKLKLILSSSLYSDQYSFIREIVCNSLDANEFVKSDKKVEITFNIDESGKYLSIKDYGTGLSPQFVKDTFSKIGKSTKELTNDFRGCFGLGRMSLLSYQDSAFFISNYEGFEYTYMISKENGVTFNLLSSKETTEPNGTTVKVYLRKEWRETDTIIKEIQNKCAYFEGIKCDYLTSPLIKNEHFYYCNDFIGDNNIHIALGGVYYKLPWNKLGMKPISISVAIPFEIGSLPVTPNREELRIEKHHLELIETKLLNLMSYLKANVKTEFDNIHEYLAAKKGSKVEFVKGLWISYDDLGIENLVYTPLKELNLKDILPDLYWGTINKTKCELTRNSRGYCDKYSKRLLIKDKDLLNTKYFRSYVQGNTVIEIPRLNLHKWITFLQLKRFPKSEWRRLINFYMNWFEKEFKVTTFTELRDSQEFKDYVTEEKKNIVRQSSYKRDSITWIARWSSTNEDFTVWDSNLSESNGDKIYVTNKTPKYKVEFLMSLISNTKIQMLKAKEENYEWVEEDNIVATVYYSLVVSKFLDTNEKWIKIAKQCLSPEVSKSLKKLEDFTYSNKVTISSKSYQFKESLKKLVDLHSLTDPISKELEFIEEQIKEHEYFNWMKHEYYRSEETTKLFNYIQSLKNISK